MSVSDISVFWMMIRARDSVVQNRAWPLEIRRATAKTMDRAIVEIKIGQRFDADAEAVPCAGSCDPHVCAQP